MRVLLTRLIETSELTIIIGHSNSEQAMKLTMVSSFDGKIDTVAAAIHNDRWLSFDANTSKMINDYKKKKKKIRFLCCLQILSFHSGCCTNSLRNIFPHFGVYVFLLLLCVKGGVCAIFFFIYLFFLSACNFFFSSAAAVHSFLVIQYLGDSCKAVNVHKGTKLFCRECALRWFNQFGKHFSVRCSNPSFRSIVTTISFGQNNNILRFIIFVHKYAKLRQIFCFL